MHDFRPELFTVCVQNRAPVQPTLDSRNLVAFAKLLRESFTLLEIYILLELVLLT